MLTTAAVAVAILAIPLKSAVWDDTHVTSSPNMAAIAEYSPAFDPFGGVFML